MFLIGLAAVAMAPRVESVPTLWLDRQGHIEVGGLNVSPQFNDGASRINTANGVAYNFYGHKSGILFGDMPELKLGGSLTVSVWLFARSYVNDGPGAQVLFRGDDRNGLDPYSLVLQSDGTINFHVANSVGGAMEVKAELPLGRWIHVTGSYDIDTGELALWLNDQKTAYAHTSVRVFTDLDPGYTPGVGVGNVQNNHGPHNQPYNGLLMDLRLYPAALSPSEAGYDGPMSYPPLQQSRPQTVQ